MGKGVKGYGFEAFFETVSTDSFKTFFDTIGLEKIHILVRPDKRKVNKFIMRILIMYSN